MTVQKAGHHVPPPGLDHLRVGPDRVGQVRCDGGEPALGDRNIVSGQDLAGVDVHPLAALDHKVGRGTARGHCHKAGRDVGPWSGGGVRCFHAEKCQIGRWSARWPAWRPRSPPDMLRSPCRMDVMSKPILTITYCSQCNWLLRSAWMAQEVLATFAEEVGGVTLVPGTGGIFEIRLDAETIWNRTRDGGFPDIRALKQMVRDRVAPDRALGHTDRARPG